MELNILFSSTWVYAILNLYIILQVCFIIWQKIILIILLHTSSSLYFNYSYVIMSLLITRHLHVLQPQIHPAAFIFSRIGMTMSKRGLLAASSFMQILIRRVMCIDVPGGVLMRRPSSATYKIKIICRRYINYKNEYLYIFFSLSI